MASSNSRIEECVKSDVLDKQVKNVKQQHSAKKSKGYNRNNEGKNYNKKTSQKVKEPNVRILHNNQSRRSDSKKKNNSNETSQLLADHNILGKSEVDVFLQKLKRLQEDGIFPLRKKSSRFPRAKFFCRLCEYHCDTVEISLRHIEETRHTNLKEIKLLERSLSVAFPPVQEQIDAIADLIEEIHTRYGITEEEVSLRKNIINELEKELQKVIEGSVLVMNGSTLSGCALKTSGLDVNILVPEKVNLAAGLLVVKSLIEANPDKYIDPVTDTSSSYPCMSFKHKANNVRVVVGITNQTSLETNLLFSYYACMDRRVKVLVTALRYWAKVCEIDNQEIGTLAPHCFPLMVIHFFQQTKPKVLPVLHELLSIENSVPDLSSKTKEIVMGWSSQNEQSVGELWLDLLKFYAVDFKIPQNVVNVRQSEPLPKSESKWGKRLAIEDPFCTKRNQTHTVSSPAVFDYIDSRIKVTYKYFITPQMSYGPLFKEWEHSEEPLYEANNLNFNSEAEIEKKLADTKPVFSDEEDDDEEEEDSLGHENGSDKNIALPEEEEQLVSQIRRVSLSAPNSVEHNESDKSSNEDAQVKSKHVQHRNIKDLKEPLERISKNEALALMQQITKVMLLYSFKAVNFTGGKKVPVHCKLCQKKGHTMSNCVEDELPSLKPLPPLNQSYIRILSELLLGLQDFCSPKFDELNYRDYIVRELQKNIRTSFPKAILKLFGSSANGFGFGNSDLDICITFDDNPTGEDLDYIDIIEKIAKLLKKNREYHHVLAITSAKVPIVKFSLPKAKLEVDLSLYNTLALQNTKLLNTYAAIDNRVKILGFTMKYFAKLCDIGDASRGSLSSYAYILLVLHFLQQCKPAVIPVLQELYDPTKGRPEMLIDGWNAWFYEDLNTLPKVWNDYGKNKQPAGMLWIQLLRYYTEVFKWKDFVVTIKQLSPLTKLEKLWTNKCLAIEDPFDHNHNLGSGLSRKMNAYILKSFIKGRELFGRGAERPPYGYPNLASYLFNKQLLTDGAPPNDRGCRLCGRIGHMVKECPDKLRRKEERGKATANNKRKQQKEKKSPPLESVPVPSPPASAPVVSVVERKPAGETNPTKNSEPKSKDVTVASPSAITKNVEKNHVSESWPSDRNLPSPFRDKPVFLRNDSLPSGLVEVPVPPPPTSNAVSLSNNPINREISPDLLFQLASKLTGSTKQLPSLSQLSNAMYSTSLVPPPGFGANTKVNDIPVARTMPPTVSSNVGNLNQQLTNCVGNQPDTHQMHMQTKPIQIPQPPPQIPRFPSQQQSPQVVQNQTVLHNNQLLPQQQSPQHQRLQNQNFLQYQNLSHLQMHTSQSQTPHYQTKSLPAINDLAYRLLVSSSSQGTSSPPVMRPNFGGSFPPPEMNLGRVSYSQALQLRAKSVPVPAPQSQQQLTHPMMQFPQQQQYTANHNSNTSNSGSGNVASSPPAGSITPFQNQAFGAYMPGGKQGLTSSSGASSPNQVLRPYSSQNAYGNGQSNTS